MELHGGSVTAASAAIGTGSVFTLQLPHPPVGQPSLRESREINSVAANHRLRLMVVDDNVDAAGSIAMLLESWGYTVSVEYAAHAALARAGTEAPQVFLLDIGLPDMDGYALAVQLRAMPQTANATLIALTGYGRDEDKLRSQKAGFDHHLVKPTNPAQLAELLAAIPAYDT